MAGALVALGATAGDAFADARVGLGPPLVVQVLAKAGSAGSHAIVVGPFRDGSRVGWRVRQAVFGQPPFSSVDPDCFVNGIVNDVVCRGPQTGATITMGDVRDVVRVRPVNGDVPGGGPGIPGTGDFGGAPCFEGAPPLTTATILCGPGQDTAILGQDAAPGAGTAGGRGQRAIVMPAASRSKVSEVMPSSRSFTFCTRSVGVLGRAATKRM